jgi:hypothetical protein
MGMLKCETLVAPCISAFRGCWSGILARSRALNCAPPRMQRLLLRRNMHHFYGVHVAFRKYMRLNRLAQLSRLFDDDLFAVRARRANRLCVYVSRLFVLGIDPVRAFPR